VFRDSAFSIQHSAFSIQHSAFGIRHSAFGIRHYTRTVDAACRAGKRDTRRRHLAPNAS
jgi:hypothetical protein